MEQHEMSRGIIRTNYTGSKLEHLYRVFRKGFLDGEIPTKKVIGFKFSSTKKARAMTAVARSPFVLENQIEVSKNLSEVFLVGSGGYVARARCSEGKVTGENINFVTNDESLYLLNKNIHLFTAVEDMNVDVVTRVNSGTVTITDNAEFIKTQLKGGVYYPLNTNHSLAAFIDILPFDGKRIRYNLNGVNEEYMNKLWQGYIEEVIL